MRTILFMLALTLAAALAFGALGAAVLVEYVVLCTAMLVGGACVLKLHGHAKSPQRRIKDAEDELEDAARLVEHYRRKLPQGD